MCGACFPLREISAAIDKGKTERKIKSDQYILAFVSQLKKPLEYVLTRPFAVGRDQFGCAVRSNNCHCESGQKLAGRSGPIDTGKAGKTAHRVDMRSGAPKGKCPNKKGRGFPRPNWLLR